MVTTFLAIFIGFSAQSIALLNLVLLLFNLPGSYFAKWACMRWNPLQSYRMGFLCLGILIAAAVAVLDGPERKNYAYLFAALWGFAMGWVYPSQRVLFCTLIPKGQETEMMGLFTFCSQIIGWLPPLIFTILNQRGIDMRWGLSFIVLFIFIALACTLGMGSYEQAVAEVENLKSNTTVSDDIPDPEAAKKSELPLDENL
jgi:MFS-type transporter involved in bile tolerance (Atg22 family)